MNKVKVYKENKKIKTYEINSPNINPFISEYLGSLMFYPYPLKNNISDDPEYFEYKLFNLENEYIKLSILPELGGKVYSAVDKRNNEDIFYCNPVIKPQLIGCTGAWTSGGIEFNFPNRGHRPTATNYTDTMFKEYDDGSASIIISEVGMIAWMRFSVEIKLHPKKAFIEQIVRMYNTNHYKDSYYFWTTSAEPEEDNLEFRFPFDWYMEEESREKYLWPLPEDSPFSAKGVDLRYSDTMKPFTLPFGSETLKDYMGLYYLKKDTGIAHVADFTVVPGKKVWSWGQASAGNKWSKRLTDNNERYVELQSGSVETQNEFNFIDPHNKIKYTEYWLPYSDIGPLCTATKDVISSFQIKEDQLNINLGATDYFENVKFELKVGKENKIEKQINLSPIKNSKLSIELQASWVNSDLKIVLSKDKELLLNETILENKGALDMIEDRPYISKSEKRKSKISQAEFLEKKRRYNEAIDMYNQVIDNNSDYIEAYLGKANCYIKKRRYSKAKNILEDIIDLNPENVKLNYLFGLILWYQNYYYKAVKHFYKVPNSSKLFPAATYFIAQYLIFNNKYSSALSKLNYAIENYSFDFKNNYLKLYILKVIDKKEEFNHCLNEFLKDNPFDYLANYWKAVEEDGENHLSKIFNQKQNIYNILSFFVQLNDWKSCNTLLEKYQKYCNNCDTLLLSYLNFFKYKLNDKGIDYLIDNLNNIGLDYVFPNHDIDYLVLKSIKDRSNNAKYLYGLIEYRAENYDRALDSWEDLVMINFNYSVLYRNLAYYYQKFENNYSRSIKLAKKGINKKPFNDDFFKLLFDGYKELNLKEKVKKLVKKIEESDKISESTVRVWIDMLDYLGNYKKAVELIEKTNFKMYEKDPENLVDYSKIYKNSYLGLTREYMKNKEFNKALNSIKKCLEMEKRYEDSFAEMYFYIAVIYEKLNKYDKALNYYKKIINENITKDDENYNFYVKAANRIVDLNWIGI